MSAQPTSGTKPVELKGYFVGEVATQTEQVVAKPDGTAMNDKQWQVEVLNKLDTIYSLIKDRL